MADICFYSDVHVYYFQANAEQLKFARELWERIRRECVLPFPLHFQNY